MRACVRACVCVCADWICEQELVLLQQLQQLKNQQIIHPALQQGERCPTRIKPAASEALLLSGSLISDLCFVFCTVGMKLNLLDPAAPIDLHYLGVALPSPVLTSSSRKINSEDHGSAVFGSLI